MKSRFCVALVFVTCLGIAGVRADDELTQKSQLQGVWILSKGETNGQSLDELLKKQGLDGLKVEFSDDLLTMSGFGGPEHTYRFKLSPMDSPPTITLITVETHGKAPKGTTTTGIYKIEENELKLCLPGDPTDEPPKKFEAPSGSRLSMLVLRRQASEDKPPAQP